MQQLVIETASNRTVGRRRLARRLALERARELSDAELVALVIGQSRTKLSPLAEAQLLIDAAGGIEALGRLTPPGLAALYGVDPVRAARLAAAFELGRRALLFALEAARVPIGSFDGVVDWARPRLAALEHEEVWLMCLDGRNGLKSAQRIAQGGLHGCALTASDVLRPALRDAASAIVLVHNHPSGDPQPSPDDVQMTRAVVAACDVVGLQLLDHVIVARGGASSLLEIGALSPPVT